jgi:hypothetical protein
MRRKRIFATAVLVGLLGSPLAYAVWHTKPVTPPASALDTPVAQPLPPAPELSFRELFAPGPRLRPSEKVLALANQRVRMVGFMVEMESPPSSGFYFTAHPVHCDEAGAGTGDLPPETVLVVVESGCDEPVQFMRGALEVSGVLEVGNQTDSEGRVSGFRLLLDTAS